MLGSNKSWGQFSALNSYYQLGKSTYFKDVIYHEDSLIILGEVYDPNIKNIKNACLIRADTFGNIAKVKYFYIPQSDSPHLLSENTQLAQTSDGGFIFSGQIFFSPYSITLVKVNAQFEVEFFKELFPEGGTTFPQKVIETKDAYFIGLWLGYGIQDKDLQYCVVKTDLQGNKLWHKFYGTETEYDKLFNIKLFKEGEITLLGNMGLFTSITTIDTAGTIVKNLNMPADVEGNVFDIDTLANGDYMYICSKFIDPPNYITSLRVYRVDSSGNVIWKKVINDAVHNAYLYRMHRNANDTYTIIGKEEGKGRSLCITQDGEVLWQHIYKLPFSPMPIDYYSALLGMTALPGGNMIACGYFRDLTDLTDEEQGWLVKMDDNGCIDKNCKTLLEENHLVNIDERLINVYPNPNNGSFKMNIPEIVNPLLLVIYDVWGREVFKKDVFPGMNEININSVSNNGIVFFCLLNEHRELIKSGKLVMTR